MLCCLLHCFVVSAWHAVLCLLNVVLCLLYVVLCLQLHWVDGIIEWPGTECPLTYMRKSVDVRLLWGAFSSENCTIWWDRGSEADRPHGTWISRWRIEREPLTLHTGTSPKLVIIVAWRHECPQSTMRNQLTRDERAQSIVLERWGGSRYELWDVMCVCVCVCGVCVCVCVFVCVCVCVCVCVWCVCVRACVQ